MKEILFKAKELDSQEWVIGSLVKLSEYDYRIASESDVRWAYTGYGDYDGTMTKIDADTICQFTGLLDKNGNKIWENDIVDTHNRGHGYSRLERVIYENGGFFPISTHGWECEPDADEIEVIGNVFDNKELLEE